jgi:hypothetical protein
MRLAVIYAITLAGDDGRVKTFRESAMNRNVVLLALSQALAMTVVSLMLSASALVSVELSAAPGWATLPLAVQYLATMLALHPLARLMARRGGGRCSSAARWSARPGWRWRGRHRCRQLRGVRAVGLCVGVLGAARQFYRFAAAEAVPAAQRGQAISLTLAGGVLAAFSGRSSPAYPRSGRDALSASFAVLVGAGPAGGRLGRFLRLPCAAAAGSGAGRRAACARSPARALPAGGGGGAVGYGVMGLLMTATPLAMLCAGTTSAPPPR